MKSNIKNAIRESLIKILLEEAEEQDTDKKADEPKRRKSKLPPGTISTKGAFGSGGRPRRFIADAKARATKDPKGLLKDLNIVDIPVGNDVKQSLDIFNQSIHRNRLMSQAFIGARMGKSKTVDGESVSEAVIITMGELDQKNGVRFLANTLQAASAAGFLSLSGALQFSQGERGDILLYSA